MTIKCTCLFENVYSHTHTHTCTEFINYASCGYYISYCWITHHCIGDTYTYACTRTRTYLLLKMNMRVSCHVRAHIQFVLWTFTKKNCTKDKRRTKKGKRINNQHGQNKKKTMRKMKKRQTNTHHAHIYICWYLGINMTLCFLLLLLSLSRHHLYNI